MVNAAEIDGINHVREGERRNGCDTRTKEIRRQSGASGCNEEGIKAPKYLRNMSRRVDE